MSSWDLEETGKEDERVKTPSANAAMKLRKIMSAIVLPRLDPKLRKYGHGLGDRKTGLTVARPAQVSLSVTRSSRAAYDKRHHSNG
jgi:hypothetical protein